MRRLEMLHDAASTHRVHLQLKVPVRDQVLDELREDSPVPGTQPNDPRIGHRTDATGPTASHPSKGCGRAEERVAFVQSQVRPLPIHHRWVEVVTSGEEVVSARDASETYERNAFVSKVL